MPHDFHLGFVGLGAILYGIYKLSHPGIPLLCLFRDTLPMDEMMDFPPAEFSHCNSRLIAHSLLAPSIKGLVLHLKLKDRLVLEREAQIR